MVYVREDEWMIMQQLFKVDVELRRETIVDDVGQSNVILVPGIVSLFISVIRHGSYTRLCDPAYCAYVPILRISHIFSAYFRDFVMNIILRLISGRNTSDKQRPTTRHR